MSDLSKISPILTELETAFFDIPFENSDFQNRMFVVASQLTPARAYRSIGLRMFAKIRAIKENIAALELADIDVEENEYKASLPETSEFDRRRLVIENRKIRESREWTRKLFNDAMRELDCLYSEFKKYPRYTREQFESEERVHFQYRLEQALQIGEGAAGSLAHMNQNATALQQMLESGELIKLLEGATKDA